MINKSTIKTLEILEKIANTERGVTITELSRELNIPRSSVDDIIKALLYKRYICCENKNSKTYKLGNKILELSLKIREKDAILKIINPFLKQLVSEFNDTAFFALKDEDNVLYMSKIESSKNVRTTAVLGSRKGLYYTGLGKSILACYSRDEFDTYLKRVELLPMTAYTITNMDEFKNDINETRERGYAIDFREGDEDISCVAAPILKNESVIGAISVAGLYTNISTEEIKKRGNTVMQVAKEISKLLS